jgi:hypothetical protein
MGCNMVSAGFCLSSIKSISAPSLPPTVAVSTPLPSSSSLATDGYGDTKAIALSPSGALLVPQELKEDPVAEGRPPAGLLDVLSRVQHTSPSYSYLGETNRQLAASVVADLEVKPTSTVGLTKLEAVLSTIATVPEPLPRYWVLDRSGGGVLLEDELSWGVRKATEAKVIADIAGTSGIQLQSFRTRSRKHYASQPQKREVLGYAPSAFVMHQAAFQDWSGSCQQRTPLSGKGCHMTRPEEPYTGSQWPPPSGWPRTWSTPWAPTVSHSISTPSAWRSAGPKPTTVCS